MSDVIFKASERVLVLECRALEVHIGSTPVLQRRKL